MINIMKAESLKFKRTDVPIMIVGFPMLVMMIAGVLLTGEYVQQRSYNWWYTLFFPLFITLMASFSLDKDQKYNWHGLMGIIPEKSKFWLGKIVYYSYLTLKAAAVFLLLNLVSVVVIPQRIEVVTNIFASFVLFITFLWQIPICMFLTLKIGKIPTLILNMMLNIGSFIVLSASDVWMMPYAIPARLMIPIIDVLPNGLFNNGQGVLADGSVIFPGILISIVLYVILSFGTAWVFKNKEY